MFVSFFSYGRSGDNMKKLLSFLLLAILALCLVFGMNTVQLSKQALTLWFENLVPSMFVTMVLIRVLYKQHMLDHLVPSFLCKPFGVDQTAMALIISTMLLGFPNGSLFIEEALNKGQIDQDGAKRLFNICCFPTPGFVILSCGVKLYHSIHIGFLLYFSQLAYGLIALWMTRSSFIHCYHDSQLHKQPIMKDLSSSMLESGTSLFMIGGYLMLFMSVTGILFSFLPEVLRYPLSICSEFSNGIFLIQQAALPKLLSFMASCALLGFGGFCVHMQIYSMCEHSKVNYRHFFLYRIFQSLLSTSIFCILLQLLV